MPVGGINDSLCECICESFIELIGFIFIYELNWKWLATSEMTYFPTMGGKKQYVKKVVCLNLRYS